MRTQKKYITTLILLLFTTILNAHQIIIIEENKTQIIQFEKSLSIDNLTINNQKIQLTYYEQGESKTKKIKLKSTGFFNMTNYYQYFILDKRTNTIYQSEKLTGGDIGTYKIINE